MKTLGVLLLTLVGLVAVQVVQADTATVAPLVGTWEGTLQTNDGAYRARLNITKDESGVINVTVDSLDQNNMGIPTANVSLKGSTFHFELPSLEGVYEGTVDDMKTLIKGVWVQRSNDGLPLDFKKVK
jgi:hypothetical protein